MNRRAFIKQVGLGIAGMAFSCGAFRHLKAAQQSRKPNVILIYTDDQGSIDTNVYGATMISWPGHMPENKVRKQLATNCDWLPTIAEYCQVDLPDRTLDGTSLVPIIRSGDAPDAHDVFHWQSGRTEWGPQWAVRKGPWKLVGNPRDTSHKAEVTEDDNPFLANLDKDITEMTNFADEHPDIVHELTSLHKEWINEVGVEDQ